MNQIIKLNRLPAENKKAKETQQVWVNLGTVFYMETGIRNSDNAPYTVIHSTSPGEQKVIVIETPEAIQAMMHQVKEIKIVL